MDWPLAHGLSFADLCTRAMFAHVKLNNIVTVVISLGEIYILVHNSSSDLLYNFWLCSSHYNENTSHLFVLIGINTKQGARADSQEIIIVPTTSHLWNKTDGVFSGQHSFPATSTIPNYKTIWKKPLRHFSGKDTTKAVAWLKWKFENHYFWMINYVN